MAYLATSTAVVDLPTDDPWFKTKTYRKYNPKANPALQDDCIKRVPLSSIRPELRNDEKALALEFCRGIWSRWGRWPIFPSPSVFFFFRSDADPWHRFLGAEQAATALRRAAGFRGQQVDDVGTGRRRVPARPALLQPLRGGREPGQRDHGPLRRVADEPRFEELGRSNSFQCAHRQGEAGGCFQHEVGAVRQRRHVLQGRRPSCPAQDYLSAPVVREDAGAERHEPSEGVNRPDPVLCIERHRHR